MHFGRLLLAATAMWLVALAAPAMAGTTRVVGDVVVFTASPGERNHISVSEGSAEPGNRKLIVSDAHEPMAPNPGCQPFTTNAVSCQIRGDSAVVRINAGNNNDNVNVQNFVFQGVSIEVNAGSGEDVVAGGQEQRNRLDGGRGNDTLIGGVKSDHLLGRSGNDELGGFSGDDRLNGGRGKDFLSAGIGNDRLFSVDTRRERVLCGPGSDRARVDTRDRVARSCESVSRKRVRRRRRR